jgi:hypothetical protein
MGVDLVQAKGLWELLGLESLLHAVVVAVGAEGRQHMHSDPGEKEWEIGRKVGIDLFRHNRRVLQETIVA